MSDDTAKAFSARTASISGLSMVYNRVLTTLVGIYTAHALGAELYGSYNLARNIFVVLSVVTPLGLDLALQRYLNQKNVPERLRFGSIKYLRVLGVLLTVIPVIALFCGLSDWVAEYIFPHPHFTAALSITMLCLPFATDLAILGGAFRGRFNPVPCLIAVNCVQPTIRAVSILILLLMGQGLFAVLYGTVLGFAVSALYLAFKAKKYIPDYKITLCEGMEGARLILQYSPSMAISLFVFTLARATDSLAVGYWHSSADAGQYAMILMAVQFVSIISSSIGQTLGSALSVAYVDNDKPTLASLIRQNMFLCSALCAPFCVAIALWGSDIDLILGQTYVIAPAAFIVGAAGQFVISTTQNASMALTMTNRHNTELVNNIISLLVQIAACIILVPPYGIVGAGMATLIAMVIINAMRQVQISRMLEENVFSLKLLLPLILSTCAAIPFYLAFRTIPVRTWWITGIVVSLYTLTAAFLMFKIILPPPMQKMVLRQLLRR